MFEIDKPKDQASVPFTARFATSRDLKTWELTPPEANYAKDRYTAPHCLRYLDGYFYDFWNSGSASLPRLPATIRASTSASSRAAW
jgi:hypothetical protein